MKNWGFHSASVSSPPDFGMAMPLALSMASCLSDVRSPDGASSSKTTDPYTVLSSGPEFFGDFINGVRNAKKYIFVNMFLWRNDASGSTAAAELFNAAERGVQVYIAKDRIGAFFEYGESDGQSFWHDTPQNEPLFGTHSARSMLLQSKMFAGFYGNQPTEQRPNPLADQLRNHPNVTVIDGGKTYDHSKAIIIDGDSAYLGGAGLSDEFCAEQPWLDFMMKIENAHDVENLMHAMVGESPTHDSELLFATDDLKAANSESLFDDMLSFIRNTKESLTVVMPFLGSVPCIQALGDVIRSGRSVQMVTSKEASSNRYRNPHFLKRLIRECRGSLQHLELILTDRVTHGKLLLRDDAVRLGSQNMVMGDNNMKRVVDETVVQTELGSLVEAFRVNLESQLATMESSTHASDFASFNADYPWHRIIAGSRVEWLGAFLQHRMAASRAEAIQQARKPSKEILRQLIQ